MKRKRVDEVVFVVTSSGGPYLSTVGRTKHDALEAFASLDGSFHDTSLMGSERIARCRLTEIGPKKRSRKP